MIGRAVLRACVVLALALGGAGAARAQNFNFSYFAGGTPVMGTFVTTSQGNGTYLITNILNGTRGGSAISLVRSSTNTRNDNILTFQRNAYYFDQSGLSYKSGSTTYRFYSDPANSSYIDANSSIGARVYDVTVTAVAAPAPLPGGGLLSFLALGLAGLIPRRRAIHARVRQALSRTDREMGARGMIGGRMLRAWVLLALALGGAGAARAQNFDFSYSANGTSAMGTFVTTSQGNGTYLITNILNGTRGGSAITLLPPGSFGRNDNLLYTTQPYFDTNGFAFTGNGTSYKVFYLNARYNEAFGNIAAPASNVTVTPAVAAPAPLPGGGLLSFLALGLAGLIPRRRAIHARVRGALARLARQPAAAAAA